MKFMLAEMTFLKYFVPIVDECNSRGIRSSMFVMRNNKYNCPYSQKNKSHLMTLSREHDFSIIELDFDNDAKGDTLITIEGSNRARIKNKSKTLAVTFSTDFTVSYKSYVDDVDYVVIGSEYSARHYGTLSNKNLYLGSPKFDAVMNKSDTVVKYKLNGNRKRAVVFYPRTRDLGNCPLAKIVSFLKMLDFEVVCKTRGKDPLKAEHVSLFDAVFDDVTWYPHTSLELICASDIAINFSSSVIEETTAYGIPMINYHIKPFPKPFDFLYNYRFVENADVREDFETFKSRVESVVGVDHRAQFEEARKTILGSLTSSKDIVDKVTE